MDKKEVFVEAIKKHEGLIYKMATLYTGTVDDRNDLVQEIIYNLWKSFDTFNSQSTLTTWMYRVAMNVAIYHLKTSKRRVQTVAMGKEYSGLQDVDNNADYEEQMRVFKLHIDRLNLLDKGILLLYMEDKSYADIGEILGISESNVGTKMARIKHKLKTQIIK